MAVIWLRKREQVQSTSTLRTVLCIKPIICKTTGNGKVYSFLISALQLVDSTLLQCQQVIILTADEESALNILSIARQLSVNSGIMSVIGDCDSIARFEQNTDVVPAHITIIPKTQLAVAVSNTNSHKYFEHVRFLVIDGADGILDDTGFKPSCGGASNSDSNKTVDTSVQSAAVALSSQLTHPNLQTVVFTSLLTPNVTDLITNLKLREPVTWVLDETKKKNKNTGMSRTQVFFQCVSCFDRQVLSTLSSSSCFHSLFHRFSRDCCIIRRRKRFSCYCIHCRLEVASAN